MSFERHFRGLERYSLDGVVVTGQTVGIGSYSQVVELEYRRLKCASKRLHSVLYSSINSDSRSADELVNKYAVGCQLHSEMRHPNIVSFLGMFYERDNPVPMIVMELLPTDLVRCIEQYGVLPIEISCSILHDVSLGLNYLHSQNPPIMHRDLSTRSILLSSDMTAKISGLMTAKPYDRRSLLDMTKVPGNFVYMPPEACVDPPHYDTMIDVFSFGVIMIHVFSGVFPMPTAAVRTNPDGILIAVSEAERREKDLRTIGDDHPLMDLILKCINYHPPRRGTAAEIVQRLKDAVVRFPPSYANKMEMLSRIKSLEKDLETQNVQVERRVTDTGTQLEDVTRQFQEANQRAVNSEQRTTQAERRTADVTRQLQEANQRAMNAEQRIAQAERRTADVTRQLQEANQRAMNAEQRPAQVNAGDELAPFRLHFQDPLPANRQVGSGCYGTVYAVEIDGVQCIAKRVQDILLGERGQEAVGEDQRKAMEEKFRRECILLSKIRHPNIVQFMGVRYGRDMYDLTLVMERLPMDLQKCLERCNTDKFFIPLSIRFSVLVDVTYGLLHLHNRSILHRDLTAGNILLTSNLRAKIADLGVSRIVENRHSQELSTLPGTIGYMPPEALKDNAEYDLKLDVFSFGVLALFVALQKFPKFSWEHVPVGIIAKGEAELYKRRTWISAIGERHFLYPLIHQCLQDNSTARPSTVELNAMVKELSGQFPHRLQDINKMFVQLKKLGMSDIVIP